jgi:hypothetical protein
MRKHRWLILFGLALVAISVVVYLIDYAIFRDGRHLFMFMLHDLAFVPIEVLFVTLIIHRLLQNHEKLAMLGKMNMAVGAFYTEVGTQLLRLFARLEQVGSGGRDELRMDAGWPPDRFDELAGKLAAETFQPRISPEDLSGMRDLLVKKKSFLLGLLQNPNLLEHESFTDLLWSVLHLAEELESRESFTGLPASDLQHLAGDVRRARSILLVEWIRYMKHLRTQYPYLFSLAVRRNPFDAAASVVIMG